MSAPFAPIQSLPPPSCTTTSPPYRYVCIVWNPNSRPHVSDMCVPLLLFILCGISRASNQTRERERERERKIERERERERERGYIWVHR